MSQRRAQRGFTLIELMISLVIFSLAIASVLSVAVSMAQSFRQRRQLVHSEDNVRGAMDYIADAIRNSGPAVSPAGGVRDDTTCTIMTGGISVTNVSGTPDNVTVVLPAGGVVTSIANTSSYTVATDASFVVTDATGISVGDQLLVTDLTNADIVTVTNIAGTTISFTKSTCNVTSTGCDSSKIPACTTTYPKLSLVIRVMRAKFGVDQINANGFGTNVLVMDPDADGTTYTPEPLAENVEDMQIALGYDTDLDNYVTSADNGGKPWIYDSSTNVTIPATGTLRALRITFIVKNGEALPQTQSTALFKRPAAEDHAAAATPDWYPRRVLSSVVELRNYKGSP